MADRSFSLSSLAAIMNKKIFLVEDDLFLASLLKNKFFEAGFDVICAQDGEQAIKILKDQKPDIIILDLILPKKNGFEVMQEINKNPVINKAPIIIVSNLGQDEDISRGKELGAIEYFVKARISIEDLVEKIKKFLNEQAPSL